MSAAFELAAASSAGLVLSYSTPAKVAALSAADRSRVLGCVVYSSHPAAPLPLNVEVTHVPMPLLGNQPALCEVWTGNVCVSGESPGVQFRHDGERLFGRVVVDERTGFERSMRAAYDSLLDLIEMQRYPTLLRVWNYLPAINELAGDEERYRQFNRARQESFLRARRSLVDNVPAACALGLASAERPVIYFIASRGRAISFENPRQVRASDYPPDYGERSPVFSRACLADEPRSPVLFVSGTASILGHATRHDGDVARQTHESLVNIASLLDAVASSGAGPGLKAADLAYKVYLRNAADQGVVGDIMSSSVGTAARVLYAQADICRRDLLVEIEAAGPAC